MIDINDELHFSTAVTASQTPVLVDFWADWCMPCKALAPILEQVNDELDGRVSIVKVDVDAHPEIAKMHQVRSFPTLILFSAGKELTRVSGVRPKSFLINLITEYALIPSETISNERLYAGLSPHEALMVGDVEAVRAAVELHPEAIDELNEEGMRPLEAAIYSRQKEAADLLRKSGAELGFFDCAAFGLLDRLVSHLREKPEMIAARNAREHSAVQIAAFTGQSNAVEFLLRESGGLRALSYEDRTTLITNALISGDVSTLKLLFDAGVDLSQFPDLPSIAVVLRPGPEQEQLHLVELLLAHGADPSAEVNGMTMIQIAEKIGHVRIARHLKDRIVTI